MSIERIGVLGAGAMGHGIAQVAAQGGFEAVLCDLTEELVEAGIARIRANLAKGVEIGKLEAGEMDAVIERVGTTTDLAELAAGADLIVEAIPEDLDLKRDALARMEASCSAAALFATNTSSLSIGAIAEGLSDPGFRLERGIE